VKLTVGTRRIVRSQSGRAGMTSDRVIDHAV
jgi:hypothetical protein